LPALRAPGIRRGRICATTWTRFEQRFQIRRDPLMDSKGYSRRAPATQQNSERTRVTVSIGRVVETVVNQSVLESPVAVFTKPCRCRVFNGGLGPREPHQERSILST
jgi:hypothetical protein